MRTNSLPCRAACLILAGVAFLVPGAVHAGSTPVGTAFTYQGQLKQGGAAVNGTADLEVSLWDGSDGSATQIGTTQQIDAVAVAEGMFSVDLDFGASAFGADARWLQVAVRSPAGSGTFTTLAPRQRVRPAPVASHALSVNGATITNLNASNIATGTIGSSLLSGTYSNAMTFANAGNSYTGNGAGLTSLNASNIAAGTIGNARTTGTSANTANTLVLRDASGNFSAGTVTATHVGNGAGLTNLNASNITTGTLPSAALSGPYVSQVSFNNSSNGFAGNGALLVDLNASSLSHGSVPSGRLAGTYASSVEFTSPGNIFVGDGLGLELDASKLVTGMVPTNRIGGTFQNSCTFLGGVFNGLHGGNAQNLVNIPINQLTGGFLPPSLFGGAYTNPVQFPNTGNNFVGHGPGLTDLNADNIASGNLASARMPTGGTWALTSAQNITGPAGFVPALSVTSADYNAIVGATNENIGIGVYGTNADPNGRGVVGSATGAGSFAVYAQGNSGASGTKSFQIDHPRDPENKYLLHYSAEGPEPYNLYRGNVVLNNMGEAWVQLPDYFEDINRDFHYQLTSIGAPSPNLHIALEIVNNQFMVAGGHPGAKVSWTVTAVRNDEYVRYYPVTDVRSKPEQLRGTYQHPEIFGQPAEKGEQHRRATLGQTP